VNFFLYIFDTNLLKEKFKLTTKSDIPYVKIREHEDFNQAPYHEDVWWSGGIT
jgi:hypothetical protein